MDQFFRWLEAQGFRYTRGDIHFAGSGWWFPQLPDITTGHESPTPPEPWIHVEQPQGEQAVFIEASFAKGSFYTELLGEMKEHTVRLLMDYDMALGAEPFVALPFKTLEEQAEIVAPPRYLRMDPAYRDRIDREWEEREGPKRRARDEARAKEGGPEVSPPYKAEFDGFGVVVEYGIFTDEGCIENGFYSVAEAQAAIEDRYPDEECHIAQCCIEHREEEHEHCSICMTDEDDEDDDESSGEFDGFDDFGASDRGPAGRFVQDWVFGRLSSRKTKEAALSRDLNGVVDTLYSYSVPIALIFDRKFIVVSTREALSRTSVTTNRHLSWVTHAAQGKGGDTTAPYAWGGPPFPPPQFAFLTEGRIPTNEHEWTSALIAFDNRNEGNPPRPPLYLRGYDGDGTFKTCTRCGELFTRSEWDALPLLRGKRKDGSAIPNPQLTDEGGITYVTTLKNCPCGSTLATETTETI